ncbi:hypothetical protein PPL_11048 [Heterostelium album PN500]|uniref:UspA domain-containing protein n=1 Tax=Heterostelium pallidum (strain ATCC 26659 / Pp 5 / PN500) TaxID=670386 RepID=D3BSS8_HETP5|nr:hypothetical protein PPL_11048 [Heterostelium album PN500]EFA75543.1 hypothetical protein PPL_11048 [Heterostelium album PN500]|eukprot:XP_020427677.1 hypothetical protein PPL_11048 [Heterostelium album PN500]
MVNYMISVDKSSNSELAIKEIAAQLIDKEKDTLFLITIAEDPITFPSSAMSAVIMTGKVILRSIISIEKESKSILIEKAKIAKHLGIQNLRALLGHGNHVGEAVCKAALEKKIDYLVVGRRGMGPVKRIFIGSTSRYILEHAPCNVICIKETEEMKERFEHEQARENHEEIESFNDFERLHLHI